MKIDKLIYYSLILTEKLSKKQQIKQHNNVLRYLNIEHNVV